MLKVSIETMQDKKQQSDPPEEENSELESRIDEMMDPKRPDAFPRKLAGAPDMPEIDIFAQADSAPVEEPDPKPAAKSKASEDEPAEEKIVDNTEAVTAADPLVDDIIAKEGDDLLKAQDADIARAFTDKPAGRMERFGAFMHSWWDNKIARYSTVAVLLGLLLLAGMLPRSRYFVLNTAGVRVSASIKVLDDTTDMPLKNVSVSFGSSSVRTDKEGLARFSGLKLGSQQMTIRRLGFAAVNQQVVLGLGSNPLGQVSLKAVGTQFRFKLTDYLSGKPVSTAEASNGDADARANDSGEIVLTVGSLKQPKLDVVLTAAGYRPEKVTVDATAPQLTNVVMVKSRKEVFISKQSGRYDLYKIDIDGKNKELLLAGTGNERDQIDLVPHPTDNEVALVSSRSDKRDQDGYLLDTLTLINVDNGSTLTLDSSERIQIVDWVKDRLVYVKVKAGASAGNPDRYQLISYDYKSATRLQLASANYFNDLLSAKGVIYYAASNNYPGGQSFLGKINADSTGKQTIVTDEIYNITRGDYDTAYVSGAKSWYSYRLGDSSADKLLQQPGNVNAAKYYLDAPDGKHSLWIDTRDGKGVLLSYDMTTKKDTVLATQSGITYPVRWLDDRTVVYRIVTPQETASYAISLDGGEPKKIVDVTNTSGLGNWRYW